MDLAGMHGTKAFANLLRNCINERVLDELLMEMKGFTACVEETRRRLHGEAATVDTMVGTFLEVVGDRHLVVNALRSDLIDINVYWAVASHLTQGNATFLRAGTANTFMAAVPDVEVEFHWMGGKKPPAQNLVDLQAIPTKTSAAKVSERWDAQVNHYVSQLDLGRIRHVSDLRIHGSKFCDRAVLLQLKNGDWLLLLSEEYKTAGSGGMNPQQAVRNNRLFNSQVNENTIVTFVDTQGTVQSILLGNLVLNANAQTTDKMGIKAARSDAPLYRYLRVTKAVKAAKKKYGENPTLGRGSDTAFYFLGLQYPGRAIRDFFEGVFSALPP